MSRGWRQHALALTALGGILAALGACGSSPTTRFYTLTTVPPVTKTADRASAPQHGIGVRSVTLPADLDRPQIVTRTGPNTVQLAEFDRWSSSLRDTVANIIAANLSVLFPSVYITVYPWPPGVSIDYQVIVEVTRFEVRMDGPCALEAGWRILAKNQPAVVGHSSLNDVAGSDYASVVATKSRLVGALSGEIAAAIRNGVPVTRQNQN